LASSAGQQLVAGRIPGERIATTTVTSPSGDTTGGTELLVMSVTAPLVSGRTYRVRTVGAVAGTGNERAQVHIREDSISGNLIQNQNVQILTSSSFGYPFIFECQFTAADTGNKTFVVTIERNQGTGPIHLECAPERPAYVYVDYISG